MLQKLENMIFDGPSLDRLRYLERPDYKNATGLEKMVLEQLRREFQVVPPITLHFSNSELMAANWAFCREALVAGPTSRIDRELVAAITSQLNECPFCIEVHTSMLHGAGDHKAVGIILDGTNPNERQVLLADWARASLTPGASILADPPFTNDDRPYLIGTALMFHYTNRMVNIFLDESPLPVSISNKCLKSAASRMFGLVAGRRIVAIRAEPGKAVYYDDKAVLPEAFSWASKNYAIAKGLATFVKTLEAAGKSSLSERAQQIVSKAVEEWNGEQMPIGRAWIDKPLTGLPENEKPGAELALLSALASYRVDNTLIDNVRRVHPGDLALLNIAAWGAYVAMRRISTWIDGQVA